MKKQLIIPVFVPHKGCQYSCIYCNQKKITGQKSAPDTLAIKRVVESYLSTADPVTLCEIAFYGGSFTAIPREDQEAYLASVQQYIENGRVNGLRISTRPDAIDRTELDMLASYGVRTIELGVQSMDRQVLLASGRPYEPSLVGEVSLLIKEYGFILGHQIMIGLPGSNMEKEIETARQVTLLGPQLVRIYPTLVIEGTGLAEMYRKGQYTPLELEEAVATSILLLTILEKAGIKVIRIGLQTTAELTTPGTILAGPFHPSLGEMVMAGVFLRQAVQAIAGFQEGGTHRELKLYVNKRDISKLVGQKRRNIAYLKDRFALTDIKVVGIDCPETGWVGVGPVNQDVPRTVLTRQNFYKSS